MGAGIGVAIFDRVVTLRRNHWGKWDGNACTPMVDPCQCIAKPWQYCKVISLQLKQKTKNPQLCSVSLKVKAKALQRPVRYSSIWPSALPESTYSSSSSPAPLQPRWPPCCPSNTADSQHPQGFCIIISFIYIYIYIYIYFNWRLITLLLEKPVCRSGGNS